MLRAILALAVVNCLMEAQNPVALSYAYPNSYPNSQAVVSPGIPYYTQPVYTYAQPSYSPYLCSEPSCVLPPSSYCVCNCRIEDDDADSSDGVVGGLLDGLLGSDTLGSVTDIVDGLTNSLGLRR